MFQVRIEDDLKYSEVKKLLESVSKVDHTDNDCFVIVIMTHGEKGVLWAQDKKYPVEELWEPFLGDKCKSLVGKPKLFFVQVGFFFVLSLNFIGRQKTFLGMSW